MITPNLYNSYSNKCDVCIEILFIYSLRFVLSKVRSICTYIKVNDTMNTVFEYVKTRRLIVGYPAF